MMSMQQKAFKNMVDNAPANIRINKEGRLLYPDGTTVPLYVPIHKDDRQKLFKDINCCSKSLSWSTSTYSFGKSVIKIKPCESSDRIVESFGQLSTIFELV